MDLKILSAKQIRSTSRIKKVVSLPSSVGEILSICGINTTYRTPKGKIEVVPHV